MARDTLARVTLWPVFLASFGVPKGEKKFHGGDHREKFEKNNHHFSEKKVNYFFQIFPYGPPYEIFFHPLVPQSKEGSRMEHLLSSLMI